MVNTLKLITRNVMAAVVAVTTSMAMAQVPVELKFATSAPVGSPWQKQFDRFAIDVAAETGDSVKVSVFYASQLGAENDALAQLARGRIDMGVFTLSSVALQVPGAMTAGMPMYYDSNAQRECILDKHLLAPMTDMLAKKNLNLMGWMEVGMNQLAGKKPLVDPADLRGVKVGISVNKMITDFWKMYDAVPVATPVPEATANLSTGLIDAYLVVPAFYVPSGLNKVAPVYSIVNFVQGPALMLMSKAAQDRLSPAQRAGMARAMAKVPASQIRAEIAGLEKFLINKHKEGGGTVVEPTPAQLAEWKKPLPMFWTRIVKDLGPDAENLFTKMQAGKQVCGR